MTPPSRRAIDIFTGLVVASVGVALAGLSWRLAGFAGGTTPAFTIGTPAAPAGIGAAVALAPFGRPSAADAAPTGLALELRGILLTEPRAQSAALIAPPGGKPIAYAPGSAVNGAVIEEIAIDRVILRVNGRAELLAFPKAGAPAPGAAAGAAGPSDAPPQMQAIAPLAPPPPPPTAAGLAEQIGATPTGEGYRIGTPPSAAATRLGLQPGDLIAAVNGVAVGDPTRDRQTFAAAQAVGSASVDLVRGGRRITLSMPLR